MNRSFAVRGHGGHVRGRRLWDRTVHRQRSARVTDVAPIAITEPDAIADVGSRSERSGSSDR